MTKRTTTSTLVIDALTRADDFMTLDQLQERTRETRQRLHSAVHNLKKAKAIGVMDVDGELHFYVTPETDTRSWTFEEREEETKPRATHKRRKKQ